MAHHLLAPESMKLVACLVPIKDSILTVELLPSVEILPTMELLPTKELKPTAELLPTTELLFPESIIVKSLVPHINHNLVPYPSNQS